MLTPSLYPPDQVIVTGKLRGQRAKGMKFSDGYMIKSGQASKDYIDESVRSLLSVPFHSPSVG